MARFREYAVGPARSKKTASCGPYKIGKEKIASAGSMVEFQLPKSMLICSSGNNKSGKTDIIKVTT